LEDELSFALKHSNLTNLFSSPAPLEVHFQWINAAKLKRPDIELLDLDPRELEQRLETTHASVRSKINFADAA
jgi:DNA primase